MCNYLFCPTSAPEVIQGLHVFCYLVAVVN